MKKLSKDMRAVLRGLLEHRNCYDRPNTLKALAARGLVDSADQLTSEGYQQALLISKLPDQCAHLEIGFEKVAGLSFHGAPERAALSYYAAQGYEGASCEGGAVLLLIRAAALDVLASLNTFHSREDACTRFTEAQLKIHEDRIPEIVEAVASATIQGIVHGFREIYGSAMI